MPDKHEPVDDDNLYPARVKVFISWSGDRSKKLAEVLRDWLLRTTPNVEPWMSRTDIEAGVRWSKEVADALEATHFGIVCLTSENIQSPWLLFEAGALSKSVDNSYVVPYLFGVEPKDLKDSPLEQFQAVVANEEGTELLISTLNKAIERELGSLAYAEEILTDVFRKWWPHLDECLTNIPDKESLST